MSRAFNSNHSLHVMWDLDQRVIHFFNLSFFSFLFHVAMEWNGAQQSKAKESIAETPPYAQMMVTGMDLWDFAVAELERLFGGDVARG